MVSKEPNHLPSANGANGNADRAVTVRSVLLNRDSPDIETRLKRRRNRTQQVRFKDLEDGGGPGGGADGGRRWSGAEQGSPHPNRKSSGGGGPREAAKEATANGGSVVGAVRGDMEGTIGAVAAILARTPPHPLTPAPMRRSWAPIRPCSLTLPNPRRHCMSTAIQTSPSLQKPPPLCASQARSRSLEGGGGAPSQDDGDRGGTQDGVCHQNHTPPPTGTQDCPFPCGCQPHLSPQRPLLDGHQCLKPRTAVAVSPLPGAHSRPGAPASHPNHRPSCPPTSPVIGSNGPSCPTSPHGRKKRLGRTVSDPGKTVPPCTLPPKSEPALPSASPPKSAAISVTPPKTPSSGTRSQTMPIRTSPPKTAPSPVLPRQTPSPPRASPPQTAPHCVSSPQTPSPPRAPPPQTAPHCVSSPPQTGPNCVSSPQILPPSASTTQSLPAPKMVPKPVSATNIPHSSLPPQTVLPCASQAQTIPHGTLSTQTVLPCASHPQIVQQVTSPPQTVLPCVSHPQTIPQGTSPPQTVLPCATHPQTVPHGTSPAQTCIPPPQAPNTTQDSWRGGEREMGNRRASPLPPPPPPPPPYTPRREGCCGSGPTLQSEPPKRGSVPPAYPRRPGTPAVPRRQDPAPAQTPAPAPSATQHAIFCTEPQANTHNTPANTHNTPGNTHNPPGNTHNTPGNTPGNTHNPPGNTHNTPGNTPGNTHNPPGNTHNPPGNTHNPPGNTPGNTQNTPGNTHNPPGNTPGNTPGNAPWNEPDKMPGDAPGNPHTPAPPSRTTDPALTPGQAETLKHVQELLGGLVSGARGKLELAKAREKLLGPRGPLHDIGTLQSQLHSLEGVLETSQNTIKVLLDVIQDLEKKEAERDGRHSYRTGQDIENCGTCRDCACIIYSVEHDFRLQEGQFTRAWRISDPPDSDHSSPQTGPAPTPPPRHEDSPLPPRPSHAVKKSRRKCFWFL
ncbi:basic proline-rich protein [Anguilla rostrata]|uniref:basic proline-rich protein n=1 Tax=Anguilla rostrata TaxID=7938 RepID=UPI0030CF03E5